MVGAAFTDNRSEVLAEKDPLPAIQQVHWTIHRAFVDYQTAAEERRRLAGQSREYRRERNYSVALPSLRSKRPTRHRSVLTTSVSSSASSSTSLSPRDGARTMRPPLMSMS